ncbi:tryptophan synthase subunit alpha [Candidatus Enterococcus clewellii]|uniref:Tryptophan synthase alpha chain n=1 Tax=Candidatus Enterococcus clewellii TaxID=1834193 RepID=A0A242K8B8_9ENTE|nr:tryptophan synthase subunit alpha [Enterococcus sp. 9E7_DIV0242]OTP17414.1 tryptophan synthase, alpha subunit [Enterococcus sp. 9E7_DIV0242]
MKTLDKRLKEKQEQGQTIIVPYIMAGAQGLEHLADEIHLLEKAGASAIELGIPFSDPVADGPVIQAAGLEALNRKVTLEKIIAVLQSIETEIPLIFMSYLNPLFSFGLERLVTELEKTPVKGLIIPDMPYEHKGYLEPLLEQTDISLIPLVALTTPRERIKQLVEEGEGFIYAVAVNGVTGTGRDYQEELDEHLKFIQQVSDKPVLAGFGVATIDHVNRFRKSCAGVVVGSKIVQLLKEGDGEAVASFVEQASSV